MATMSSNPLETATTTLETTNESGDSVQANQSSPPETTARWRTRFASLTGRRLSPEDKQNADQEQEQLISEQQYQQCEKWKADLFRHSPLIRFMLQHLEAAGCPFTKRHIICQPCDLTRSGGFAPEVGVVLCENRFIGKNHMEETLAHELVHAFDHCRAKIDWSNCRHHACTEIRAASLSGDCRWTNEFLRGNWKVTKQHQACVKRRAILSLKDNPACNAPNVAEDAVADVWDSCFNDRYPFDEIFK